MKASELIKWLQDAIADHGDLTVAVYAKDETLWPAKPAVETADAYEISGYSPVKAGEKYIYI